MKHAKLLKKKADEAAKTAAEHAKTAAEHAKKVANSETTQNMLNTGKDLAMKAGETAVSAGKRAGSIAKDTAEDAKNAVVTVATSKETKEALQRTKNTVVATTGKALDAVDKTTDKYAPGAKKTVNQTIKKAEAKVNPLMKDAKRKISDQKTKALDWGNKKTLEIAKLASEKILDKAALSMTQAAGSDPDMPDVIRSTIKSTVDDVVEDIKIQLDENLELVIQGTDEHVKERILEEPAGCCQPNPYHWLKAWILYTMFPHDKSVWAQLKNPWYYFFTIISLAPYGVSQGWWLVMFLFRDKHDEYQLVNFIVSIKVAGVFSLGIIPTFIGIYNYLNCAPENTCDAEGPGVGLAGFLFANIYFCIQLLCVYMCVFLLCCAKDKGARVSQSSKELQKGDARGRRRFMKWVMYDVLTIVFVVVLIVLAYANSEPPMRETYIYWIKSVYGWLSIPWFILKLPLMFPLILHTHASAYNPRGRCVAYANAKEREQTRSARLKKYGNINCCTLYCCCCCGKQRSSDDRAAPEDRV